MGTKMERSVKALACAMIIGVLAGCAVGVLVEYGTFIGTPTANYSRTPDEARQASDRNPRSKLRRFPLGESNVDFSTQVFSRNMLAIGPVLPVIPTPGEGETFDENPFHVDVHVSPGRKSFLILNPEESLILFEDSVSPVAPTSWTPMSDRMGCTVSEQPPEIRAYGAGCTVMLFYDGKTAANVNRFTLMPAPIDGDEVLYVFPDIDYERGSLKEYQ